MTDRGGSSRVADDDVAVLGALSDHGVLAARRRRLRCVGEAHQSQVDSLSRLSDDHPRAGDRRADAERPRRVAGDDARLTAGDRVDTGVRHAEVPTTTQHSTATTAAAAAAAVTAAWDVRRY